MRINEIFESFDGEVNGFGQGSPSIFVRMQGCNLRCPYCDTPQALDADGGKDMPISRIVENIKHLFPTRKVTITGGEPLAQKSSTLALLELLKDNKYSVSVETNGTVHPTVKELRLAGSWVVDWKWQEYGYDGFHYHTNAARMNFWWQHLRPSDWIKFIISSDQDMTCLADLFMSDFVFRSTAAKLAISPAISDKYPLAQFMRDFNAVKESILTRFPPGKIVINFQIHKAFGFK